MEPRPSQELLNLYKQLCALVSGLSPNVDATTLRDGAGEKFNGYLDKLHEMTKDAAILDFKLAIKHSSRDQGTYVLGSEYARQLFSAATYVHEVHARSYTIPPRREKHSGDVAPLVSNFLSQNQENQQTTDVNIQFNVTLMQLTDLLTKAEQEHPDEQSQENKFIRAFKKLLPTAKDTLSIISLLLSTAAEFGLDPHEIAKLLHLG